MNRKIPTDLWASLEIHQPFEYRGESYVRTKDGYAPFTAVARNAPQGGISKPHKRGKTG
jgi:hypothetical protein